MKSKRIDAYIRRERLSFVLMALDNIQDFPGVTVLECQGFGKRSSQKTHKRIVDFLVEPNRHAKLEIVCAEDRVKGIIATIKSQLPGTEGENGRFFYRKWRIWPVRKASSISPPLLTIGRNEKMTIQLNGGGKMNFNRARFLVYPILCALTAAFMASSCAQTSEAQGNGKTGGVPTGISAELQSVLDGFHVRLDSVVQAIDGHRLERIHDQAEELTHARKAIGGLYRSEYAWKRKKVNAFLQQMRLTIYSLHEYADSKDEGGARRQLSSLKDELAYLEQFLKTE